MNPLTFANYRLDGTVAANTGLTFTQRNAMLTVRHLPLACRKHRSHITQRTTHVNRVAQQRLQSGGTFLQSLNLSVFFRQSPICALPHISLPRSGNRQESNLFHVRSF